VGTVVRLYLPRSREVADPAVAAPVELPTGSETILLVEDDSPVRAFGSAQFAALGYRVVTAEHARRAIELVERGCAPDLLFTDMIMPRRHERPPACQAAAIHTSGYAHNAMTGEAAAAQVMHLLGKPYSAAIWQSRCARRLTNRRRREAVTGKIARDCHTVTLQSREQSGRPCEDRRRQ
jgi:CheY-like chemotaxis protein